MAKYRFTQTYTKTIIVTEHYDIKAKSYKDAMRKISENDYGDLEDLDDAELIETGETCQDWWEYDCTKPNLTLYNEDGEEIE